MTTSRAWVVDVGEGHSVFNNTESVALLQNAALLHMVADCARVSGDQRLQSLAKSYFRMVATPGRFGRMVDPSCRFERPPDKSLSSFDDYQRWFLHAIAPGDFPLSPEDRRDMFSPDKYRTGSATHQLFALYLYRNHNGATPDLDRLIRRISARIASEASIDFRVTDHICSVLPSCWPPAQPDLVKRRWVERALAAQQPDGGWLWSWHGWQPKPFRFRFAEDEFHQPPDRARHVDRLYAEVSLPTMDREELPVIRPVGVSKALVRHAQSRQPGVIAPRKLSAFIYLSRSGALRPSPDQGGQRKRTDQIINGGFRLDVASTCTLAALQSGSTKVACVFPGGRF